MSTPPSLGLPGFPTVKATAAHKMPKQGDDGGRSFGDIMRSTAASKTPAAETRRGPVESDRLEQKPLDAMARPGEEPAVDPAPAQSTRPTTAQDAGGSRDAGSPPPDAPPGMTAGPASETPVVPTVTGTALETGPLAPYDNTLPASPTDAPPVTDSHRDALAREEKLQAIRAALADDKAATRSDERSTTAADEAPPAKGEPRAVRHKADAMAAADTQADNASDGGDTADTLDTLATAREPAIPLALSRRGRADGDDAADGLKTQRSDDGNRTDRDMDGPAPIARDSRDRDPLPADAGAGRAASRTTGATAAQDAPTATAAKPASSDTPASAQAQALAATPEPAAAASAPTPATPAPAAAIASIPAPAAPPASPDVAAAPAAASAMPQVSVTTPVATTGQNAAAPQPVTPPQAMQPSQPAPQPGSVAAAIAVSPQTFQAELTMAAANYAILSAKSQEQPATTQAEFDTPAVQPDAAQPIRIATLSGRAGTSPAIIVPDSSTTPLPQAQALAQLKAEALRAGQHDAPMTAADVRAERRLPSVETAAPAKTLSPTAEMPPMASGQTSTPAGAVVAAVAAEPSWRQPSVAALTQLSKASVAGEAKTLSIQLHPAELGVVTATLKLSGDQLTVELSAETQDARSRLSAEGHAITKSLRALGFDVDQVTVLQPVVITTPVIKGDDTSAVLQQTTRDQASAEAGTSGGQGSRTGGQQSERNSNEAGIAPRGQGTPAADRSNGLYI